MWTIWWRALSIALALAAAGCSGPGLAVRPTGTAPEPVTSAPPTAAATIVSPAPQPTATATSPATATRPATKEATSTPTGEATTSVASETVTLLWAPGAPLVDSDDIDEIIAALKQRRGILDGEGSESSISITYDPTILTSGRIILIMKGMGFPVVRP